MFVFTIMLFLIGVFNVKADFTIDFSNSDNREIASNELFTSKYKTHYRVTTNGDVVYCYQPYVDYAYTLINKLLNHNYYSRERERRMFYEIRNYEPQSFRQQSV